MIQARKIIGIVRKVCIHFKNELVSPGQSPLKSMDIRGSQSLLSSSLLYEKLSGKFCLEIFNNLGGAIGRSVVNNDYVKIFLQIEDGMQNSGNIFSFIKSRYDN